MVLNVIVNVLWTKPSVGFWANVCLTLPSAKWINNYLKCTYKQWQGFIYFLFTVIVTCICMYVFNVYLSACMMQNQMELGFCAIYIMLFIVNEFKLIHHTLEGWRKKIFYFKMHSTILLMVIWPRTCGKGPLRQSETKLTATTLWATLPG